MDKLTHHRDAYRQALQQQDNAALNQEKRWLTSAVAAAVLNQDIQTINALRATLADLPALADRFDATGKPGDRWRALTDMLHVAAESALPLEQLRLTAPGKLSGLILKHIQTQPGITPKQLAECCAKEPNHIANELKKLDQIGLIHKQRQGRNQHIYLSAQGKTALETLAPVKIVATTGNHAKLPHIDNERLKKLGEKPVLPAIFNQKSLLRAA